MLQGEAGCWVCLSQEVPAKGEGSGRVLKELGCPWDWESSELGAVKERGALGGQGGEWVDGCPREKGRNLFGLRKNPRLPTQLSDSSLLRGLTGFTSSCPAAS